MKRIRYYYDIVSPFSFLGFEILSRYESIWKVEIEYVPFLLGAIMKESGNVPPATNPFKARYLKNGLSFHII